MTDLLPQGLCVDCGRTLTVSLTTGRCAACQGAHDAEHGIGALEGAKGYLRGVGVPEELIEPLLALYAVQHDAADPKHIAESQEAARRRDARRN